MMVIAQSSILTEGIGDVNLYEKAADLFVIFRNSINLTLAAGIGVRDVTELDNGYVWRYSGFKPKGEILPIVIEIVDASKSYYAFTPDLSDGVPQATGKITLMVPLFDDPRGVVGVINSIRAVVIHELVHAIEHGLKCMPAYVYDKTNARLNPKLNQKLMDLKVGITRAKKSMDIIKIKDTEHELSDVEYLNMANEVNAYIAQLMDMMISDLTDKRKSNLIGNSLVVLRRYGFGKIEPHLTPLSLRNMLRRLTPIILALQALIRPGDDENNDGYIDQPENMFDYLRDYLSDRISDGAAKPRLESILKAYADLFV